MSEPASPAHALVVVLALVGCVLLARLVRTVWEFVLQALQWLVIGIAVMNVYEQLPQGVTREHIWSVRTLLATAGAGGATLAAWAHWPALLKMAPQLAKAERPLQQAAMMLAMACFWTNAGKPLQNRLIKEVTSVWAGAQNPWKQCGSGSDSESPMQQQLCDLYVWLASL